MRIHQFHYSVRPKDAITNQMLFLNEALQEVGIEGEIFATEVKGELHTRAKRFTESQVAQNDWLLIHHSHGNPSLNDLLQAPGRKALVYHNITPGDFFRHDPHMKNLCDLGRRQLIFFRGRVQSIFADSHYNSRELMAMGLPSGQILPLFDACRDDPTKRLSPKGATHGGEILFVGKITPHKNQALLLQMQFYLSRLSGKRFRLVLAGGQDPLYADYLRLLAKALGIQRHVHFAGRVSEAELEALYQKAVAFVCLSLHEGYCVPLVEAMRFGVPLFAFHSTGVRETLAGAGIALKTKMPHRIAEIVATALENSNCIAAMLQNQEKRLRELREIQCKARAQKLLSDLIQRETDAVNAPLSAGITI